MTTAAIAQLPWNRWWHQTQVLVRMDLARQFFTTRAIWLYLLALGPVGITGLYYVMQLWKGPRGTLGSDMLVFAGMFQFLYVRFLIFFGALAVGTFLVRGEVLGKTLHYYFLLPVRREVFLVSRYIIGVAATTFVFGVSVTASYFLIMMHRGSQFWDFMRAGQGIPNLLDYWLVTLLACAGYGAVFLLASLYFKNPLIPGAIVFVWEAINAFLPTTLQRISVVQYLNVLCPVDMPVEGPMALFVTPPEPISRFVAVIGLVVFMAMVLVISAYRVRRAEIDYSE